MRLFIAVNFPRETKAQLVSLQKNLQAHMEKGRLTANENLHLTLVFIGETERTGPIREAMNRIKGEPFWLDFDTPGRFARRGGGDLLHISVKQQILLWDIQRQLAEELLRKGYGIDEKPFKPHITLARDVVWRDGRFPEMRGESPGSRGTDDFAGAVGSASAGGDAVGGTVSGADVAGRGGALAPAALVRPVEVTRISLMKSERVSGRQVYTELYGKDL